MELTEIRIRNFRTIEAEQHIRIPGQMTLVGRIILEKLIY